MNDYSELTYEGYRIEYIAMLANLLTEKGITSDKVVDWFSNAEKVVRCKDCIYYQLFNNGCNGMCNLHIDAYRVFYPDNFCSYGERK